MKTPDLLCAETIQQAYDAFDKCFCMEGVHYTIAHLLEASVICFPGSTTALDWFRDFESLMVMDAEIGPVEEGFDRGLAAIGRAPQGNLPNRPIYVTGHSLGAARALLFAARATLHGVKLAGVITFGSPRPGGKKVADLLSPVDVRSYRNRNDPVCDVPFTVGQIEPYQHPRALLPVNVAPAPDDSWGPLAEHHMPLYLQAMQTIFPT